jgi:hypothetical protein
LIEKQGNKPHPEACLPATSGQCHPHFCGIRSLQRQHRRHPILGRHRWLPARLPGYPPSHRNQPPTAPKFMANCMVMLLTASTIAAPPSFSADSTAQLKLKPPPLRPNCRASEHIFQWKGIFQPPASTIDALLIKALAELAAHKSLRDTTSYGSGL